MLSHYFLKYNYVKTESKQKGTSDACLLSFKGTFVKDAVCNIVPHGEKSILLSMVNMVLLNICNLLLNNI